MHVCGTIICLFDSGRDILVSDDADTLLSHIECQTQVHVIQKYIENPLLLDPARKFDVRLAYCQCSLLTVFIL